MLGSEKKKRVLKDRSGMWKKGYDLFLLVLGGLFFFISILVPGLRSDGLKMGEGVDG